MTSVTRSLASLLSLFVISCVNPDGLLELKDNQPRAVDYIWNVSYRQTDKPPKILFVEWDHLNCTQTSGAPGFIWFGTCYGGLTIDPRNVYVSWYDGLVFSSSATAHEMWHSKQMRMGILDPFHFTPGFWAVSRCEEMHNHAPDCGVVEKTNNALSAMGM